MSLHVTRVVNACALLELDGACVLTDPFFDARWFLRFAEPIGLSAAALPELAAILGGHGVLDHWQPQALRGYPHRATTPVLVATQAMARRAQAAGFRQVEVVGWGAARSLGSRLSVEVVAAQRSGGMTVNSYVLRTPSLRVFVGTEARDLAPIEAYRSQHPAVDVALLPIDGASLFGRPLVMAAAGAIAACRLLGARVLVPLHYALRPVPPILQIRGGLGQLIEAAAEAPDLEVVALKPGERRAIMGRRATPSAVDLDERPR